MCNWLYVNNLDDPPLDFATEAEDSKWHGYLIKRRVGHHLLLMAPGSPRSTAPYHGKLIIFLIFVGIKIHIMKHYIFRYWLALTLCLLMWACEITFVPKEFDLSISSIDAIVDGNSVTLEAKIEGDTTMVTNCGFIYGETEEDMVQGMASLENNGFSKSFTGLKFSQKYIYKAFIENGQNIIYSDEKTFQTPAKPDIKVSDSDLSVPFEGGIYTVMVTDGKEFDIVIPEDVDWISGEQSIQVSADTVFCQFTISPSESPEPRECDVRFVRKEDGSECWMHVVQANIEYSLGLSSYETFIDGDGDRTVIFEVTGNAEVEILIPNQPYWVYHWYFDGDYDRECHVYVYGNLTKSERVCEVIVQSLNHDYSVTHRIVQGPTSYDCYKAEISHLAQKYYTPLRPDVKEIIGIGAVSGRGTSCEWADYWGRYASVEENNTATPRSTYLNASIEDYQKNEKHFIVELIQHSYLENVEFKDPTVKGICVGLWDINGDGELSFEEIAAVGMTDIQNRPFSGHDIKSFNEFQFFNISRVPERLFEGSSLESISLSRSSDRYRIGARAFKDCKNLKDIYLKTCIVEEEAFMNCTSLKEVDTTIKGERAFMGCSALETVSQRDLSIPSMAFKKCSSLRSVYFDERYDSYQTAEIGDEAFNGCTSLPEIRLHRKVNNIGRRAFYGCSSLSSIYLSSGTPPTLGVDAFTGTSPDLKIYVPSSLVSTYKSAWSALADRIEAGE